MGVMVLVAKRPDATSANTHTTADAIRTCSLRIEGARETHAATPAFSTVHVAAITQNR